MISGALLTDISGQNLRLRPFSELVVLPHVSCQIVAEDESSLSLVSFVPSGD